MIKLTVFYNRNKESIGVTYQTFKKYILQDTEKYKESLKIVQNAKNKAFYVIDEERFLRDFKA